MLPYAQCALIICCPMRSIHLESTKYLAIFCHNCAYAKNLLPLAQHLLFVVACVEYAKKANPILILPFQLNEKYENEKLKIEN
jgi:hypothetical protein